MPWAFKLCLATVTGPSLVYMTVAYVYTVNRCCLERLPGWVFWQLLTALETIVVAIKILDLDPLQQYYHSNPFHKSTTLALKNFFPNAPFGFLNSLYLYVMHSLNCSMLIQRTSAAVVFLVQWYLVLRLQLSFLCSLILLLLSCNVVSPRFFNFSTSIAQILESPNQCLALHFLQFFNVLLFQVWFPTVAKLVICVGPQYCILVSGDLSF